MLLSGLWMLITPFIGVASATFTPAQSALTDIRQIEFTLTAQDRQSFTDLMQSAEAWAVDAIQRTFVQNPTVQNVSVKILGERNGQTSPLFFSQVSRAEWQKQPTIQSWTRYFDSARFLLGFSKLGSAPVAAAAGSSSVYLRVAGQGQEGDPGFRDD